jgi:hypothetical protein
MKGTLKNSYKKVDKNGVLGTIFVYLVTGTVAEVTNYREVQDERGYLVEDEGVPLFFSNRYYTDVIDLIQIGEDDNVRFIVDTSEYDKVQSIAENNPFMKEALAQAYAQKIMQSLNNTKANVIKKSQDVTANLGVEEEADDLND